jgi:hypothetical protein
MFTKFEIEILHFIRNQLKLVFIVYITHLLLLSMFSSWWVHNFTLLFSSLFNHFLVCLNNCLNTNTTTFLALMKYFEFSFFSSSFTITNFNVDKVYESSTGFLGSFSGFQYNLSTVEVNNCAKLKKIVFF